MASSPVTVTAIAGLADVAASDWNALVGPDDPFTEHAFLLALEASGSVGRGTGWRPHHLVARRAGRVVGAAPAYLKMHSYGEFVFDWGWAEAAARAGVDYYPKLVVAVPFTPATGRRFLVAPGEDEPGVRRALAGGLVALAGDLEASSVHVLFCTAAEAEALAAQGFCTRLGMQFHWRNRTPPYRDFDDYLGALRSESRKQVRKERARAAAHGLALSTRPGPELGDAEWRALRRLYEANTDKHGGQTYLTDRFFDEMRATYAHRVVASLAHRGDDVVAGTFDFEKGRHLYGRYWGTFEEREMLHFELAYHQLIERAIARGATLFEAGAQGEHKLKRGLLPSPTWSAHRLRHEGLHRAVAQWVTREATAVAASIDAYAAHGPFRREAGGAPEKA